ncbi:MAG: alpha-L-rhamnosidase N-terminal domain-containing protein [Actinomycetota bacterium]
MTPGFTAYRKRLQVHAFDVTDLLRPGVNSMSPTRSPLTNAS